MIKAFVDYWLDARSAHLALKMALGVVMTWLLTLRLGSDATSAAMISVIMIMLTASRGASLIKAAARAGGTIMGAVYIVLISGIGLTDALLFNFFMILGIVLAVTLASYYHDSVAYMFALVGLTIAIAGFPISLNPTIAEVFDSVQARCVGIIIAIIVCESLNAIIPFGEETQRLLPIKRQAFNFMKFTISERDPHAVRDGFSHMISVVLRNKALPLQSLLSSRESIETIVGSRDALFHCLSVSIATIKVKRLIMSCDACGADLLNQINMGIEAIEQGETDSDKLMAQLDIANTNEGQIIKDGVVEVYLNAVWLHSSSVVLNQTRYSYQVSDFVKYSDNLVIIGNALRATIVLGLLTFLWIGVGWTGGMGASLMAGILLSMNATMPGAKVGILRSLKSMTICVGIGFVITFLIMPYLSSLGVFTMIFLYIYMVTYQFNKCMTGNKMIFMYMLVFWSSYTPLTNVPTFDPAAFLNNTMANFFAMILVFLAYVLIPEVSENITTTRMIRRVIKRIRKTKRYDKSISELFSSDFIVSIYPYMLSSKNDLNNLNKMLFISALSKVLSSVDMVDADEIAVTNWMEWLVSARYLTAPQEIEVQTHIDQRLAEYHAEGNLNGVGLWWEISILWEGLAKEDSLEQAAQAIDTVSSS